MAFPVTLPPHESRRFSVADIHAMAAAGVFDRGERVELLEGDLVVISPQSPAHYSVLEELAERLRSSGGGDTHVRQQAPVECGAYSAPEPDVAVVRGSRRDYADVHPKGSDCLLVVEVAVTSQSLDHAKAAIYARAAVPEYWLVDVPGQAVFRHISPDPAGHYGQVTKLVELDRLSDASERISLKVGDLFTP